MNSQDQLWDVAVVGAGIAGMSAAIFAASKGLSVLHIGNGSGLVFGSGLLDVLAVHPVKESTVHKDPWHGIELLRKDEPSNPLALVGPKAMEVAVNQIMEALGKAGMPYEPSTTNHFVPTSMGTLKGTFGVPTTMTSGAKAFENKWPTLLIEIRGLREFSAAQMVHTMGDKWPGLRFEKIEFPDSKGVFELYATHLATALETNKTRQAVIDIVRPLIGDAKAVGFPAILGLSESTAVHKAFEDALGVPVFEIPTMPTSVPGLRLKHSFEVAAAAAGVFRRVQSVVTGVKFDNDIATLTLQDATGNQEVQAKAVILATGRFMGRGLFADREKVREPLLDLFVEQPESRENWHSRDFFAKSGHAINRCGLLVDSKWRPTDAFGAVVWPRLYAVGSILARQDWMRQKSGSGLAIGTAWAAVSAMSDDFGSIGGV